VSQSSGLRGRLKLIFQPAEEGARGANAMVAAGVVDDVDVLLCFHIGLHAGTTGTIIAGYDGFFASTKLDVTYNGTTAHAGLSPELGRNALLAATASVAQMLGIPRHSGGIKRINVGRFEAGEARNAIPRLARLQIETRGETEELDAFMVERVRDIVRGAAMMEGVAHTIDRVGHTTGGHSDQLLVDEVRSCAAESPLVREITPAAPFGASDDATLLMQRVQARGGQAVYFGLGADLAADHHTPEFDFDEGCLAVGVDVLTRLIQRLCGGP
jgi:aminobenzoyl-glutamate utilization protein A